MNDLEKAGTRSTLHIQSYAPHDVYAPPKPKPTVANPSCLGLFAFGTTALTLSLYNIGARGVVQGDLIIGMAMFCGGLAQFIAGMWDFVRGDMFGASAFAMYGSFWMSYAVILIPGSYNPELHANAKELSNAVGIYLTAWFVVTFLFWIASLRKCVAFVIVFAGLAMTFMVLAAAEFTGNPDVARAGGVIGLFTSLAAYYVGLSELLADDERPLINLPLGMFSQ